MKYISIDRAAVHNNQHLDEEKWKPVIMISQGLEDTSPVKCFEVEITKPCKVIYSPRREMTADGAMVVVQVPDDGINILK